MGKFAEGRLFINLPWENVRAHEAEISEVNVQRFEKHNLFCQHWCQMNAPLGLLSPESYSGCYDLPMHVYVSM